MEGVKSVLAGAGSCVLCLLGTACSIVPIVFIVYLGIYAFNNPDQEAWYGLDSNGKQALFPDEASATAASATEVADMHQRFVGWFLWGFIQIFAPCAAACLSAIFMMISPTIGSVCGGLLGCATGCGGLAWWIAGIVWRFRADGAYSCGDIAQDGISAEAW